MQYNYSFQITCITNIIPNVYIIDYVSEYIFQILNGNAIWKVSNNFGVFKATFNITDYLLHSTLSFLIVILSFYSYFIPSNISLTSSWNRILPITIVTNTWLTVKLGIIRLISTLFFLFILTKHSFNFSHWRHNEIWYYTLPDWQKYLVVDVKRLMK